MDEFGWDDGEPEPVPWTGQSPRMNVGDAERLLSLRCGLERLQCGQSGGVVFVHAKTTRPNEYVRFADPKRQTFWRSDIERLVEIAKAAWEADLSALIVNLRDAARLNRKP